MHYFERVQSSPVSFGHNRFSYDIRSRSSIFRASMSNISTRKFIYTLVIFLVSLDWSNRRVESIIVIASNSWRRISRIALITRLWCGSESVERGKGGEIRFEIYYANLLISSRITLASFASSCTRTDPIRTEYRSRH